VEINTIKHIISPNFNTSISIHLNREGIDCGVMDGLTAVVVVVKVDCAYFAARGWFKGATSITSWIDKFLFGRL